MKNREEHIVSRLFALLLIVVLLFPSALQFHHIFESHDHNTDCKEVTTHLHEKEIDCSLCDFHLSSFNISFNTVDKYINIEVSSSYLAYYKSNKYNSTKRSFNLRGPPMF